MNDDDLRLLRARIQRLDDIEEIKQLRARYTRCIDTQDWDALRNEVTEDFHTETDGGVLTGRDVVIESISKRLTGASTVHHCHTPEITITGPDSATGTWAMQDHVKMTREGAPFSFRGAGHYHESYVRTPTGWRISRSALKRLSIDPLPAGPPQSG
jgi:hypothetical protein